MWIRASFIEDADVLSHAVAERNHLDVEIVVVGKKGSVDFAVDDLAFELDGEGVIAALVPAANASCKPRPAFRELLPFKNFFVGLVQVHVRIPSDECLSGLVASANEDEVKSSFALSDHGLRVLANPIDQARWDVEIFVTGSRNEYAELGADHVQQFECILAYGGCS